MGESLSISRSKYHIPTNVEEFYLPQTTHFEKHLAYCNKSIQEIKNKNKFNKKEVIACCELIDVLFKYISLDIEYLVDLLKNEAPNIAIVGTNFHQEVQSAIQQCEEMRDNALLSVQSYMDILVTLELDIPTLQKLQFLSLQSIAGVNSALNQLQDLFRSVQSGRN